MHKKIEHMLTRLVGRPPKKPVVLYNSFRYQAASWEMARRVVAKIEWHARELFPRVGFIVTNLRWKSSNVVRFYNKRGTAEQWIKEGKYALKWTRLSCHDFVDNQVRLQLFALAYNLGNFLRRLALPKSVKMWSLRTLREKLIKIGAKVVRHSRYVVFQMAEVVVAIESQPRICGVNMTAHGAKILVDDEKSLVEVRRKSAKILDFRRISVSWSLSGMYIGRFDGQMC